MSTPYMDLTGPAKPIRVEPLKMPQTQPSPPKTTPAPTPSPAPAPDREEVPA